MGRSYGFSFFAGFGIGSLGGVIAGVLVDTWDTAAAFLGLTVFMGAVVVLGVMLWALSERRHAADSPLVIETAT